MKVFGRILEAHGQESLGFMCGLIAWTVINIYFTIAMKTYLDRWRLQSRRPQVIPLRINPVL